VAVRVDLPDGPLWVDPQCSIFTNPGGWGRHWLLGVDDAGKLQPTYVRDRGEEGLSELEIIGKISIGSDGKATGELRTYATGLFFDPSKLKTADAQEKLVKKLVGRVLSDFGVSGHSIVMLSDEVFRATASVASKEKMEELGELVGVELGGGPAFLADVPMPMTRSYRSTDVRLEGAFRERVELTIECPKGWKPAIIPAALPRTIGPWGTADQAVEVLEKGIRLRRNVVVKTDTVAQGDFESLRQAVNDLRATSSLVVAFAPPPGADRTGG